MRAARQAHCKSRAFARLARHCHVAAHHARELAGDGKTEAGAAEALRRRGIGLGELLKQLCLLLRRHADASIGNGELDPVASIGYPCAPELDLAPFCELARIAQQIEQICRSRIGSTVRAPRFSWASTVEAVLVLLGKLARSTDHLFDQWCELHGLRIELKFAGLDLRQVEHLIDEAKQVSSGAVHALQRFLRLFRTEARCVRDHHLGKPDNGVERRAQLVADT